MILSFILCVFAGVLLTVATAMIATHDALDEHPMLRITIPVVCGFACATLALHHGDTALAAAAVVGPVSILVVHALLRIRVQRRTETIVARIAEDMGAPSGYVAFGPTTEPVTDADRTKVTDYLATYGITSRDVMHYQRGPVHNIFRVTTDPAPVLETPEAEVAPDSPVFGEFYVMVSAGMIAHAPSNWHDSGRARAVDSRSAHG